jgi:hypothetical protein
MLGFAVEMGPRKAYPVMHTHAPWAGLCRQHCHVRSQALIERSLRQLVSKNSAPGRSLSGIGCYDQPGRFLPRAQRSAAEPKIDFMRFAGSRENEVKFGS